MVENRPRSRVLALIVLGAVMLGAWLLVLTHDPVGKARNVGIAGFVTTLVTIGVLLRSYITRRGTASILFALSIVTLVLGIVAMLILTF